MRIRLTGTRAELEAAVAALARGFELREVSAAYANRPPSLLARVYVEAEPRSGSTATTSPDEVKELNR